MIPSGITWSGPSIDDPEIFAGMPDLLSSLLLEKTASSFTRVRYMFVGRPQRHRGIRCGTRGAAKTRCSASMKRCDRLTFLSRKTC
jgi:hypothetical protein